MKNGRRKPQRYNLNTAQVSKLAQEKGFRTDTALALACEMDQSTLSRLLRRKTRPSDDLLDRLAKGLGVGREELVRK